MAYDQNDSADVAALKSEMNTDPLAYGYDPFASGAGTALINNDDGAHSRTVSKEKVSAALIRSSTTYEAYDGLLGPEQSWLQWMTGSNGFEEENLTATQDLRDRLTGVLGGSVTGDSIWAAADDDAMEPAMLAIFDVPGSRAEELFGAGSSISISQWDAARNS